MRLNFLLIAILMLCSSVAFAQEAANPCANIAASTVGKNNTEVLALVEACRADATKTLVQQMANPTAASEWAEASKGFAQAIGIAAKELNIASNDFLDSPAGFLLAVLLVWNYMGADLVANLFSLVSMIFIWVFWWFTVKRVSTETVKYENVPMFWGLFTIRRVTESANNYRHNEAAQITASIGAVVAIILTIVVWAAA